MDMGKSVPWNTCIFMHAYKKGYIHLEIEVGVLPHAHVRKGGGGGAEIHAVESTTTRRNAAGSYVTVFGFGRYKGFRAVHKLCDLCTRWRHTRNEDACAITCAMYLYCTHHTRLSLRSSRRVPRRCARPPLRRRSVSAA